MAATLPRLRSVIPALTGLRSLKEFSFKRTESGELDDHPGVLARAVVVLDIDANSTDHLAVAIFADADCPVSH